MEENKGKEMIEISKEQAKKMMEEQHIFFQSGATKDSSFRKKQLYRLKTTIRKYETDILDALKKDLGKHENEGFMTEVGLIYKSITETIRHMSQWMKPNRVKTPYYMLPGKSYVISEPYGSVLIIGPFNYPFQLVIEPLIGAIAAGNCAVIKLSELTPHVSNIIHKILTEAFSNKFVWCVKGGVPSTTVLLEEKFDYIFFTGSPRVGQIVMEAAAKHLTPVTLELGGKSPVIVDETANIKNAARKILWGKTVNAGQTCVAPDYIYVHESVKDQFIQEIRKQARKIFGKDMKESKSFGRIINDSHFKRLHHILEEEKENILFGGSTNVSERYVELTLVNVTSRDQISMQEEIFGPILPIMEYSKLESIIQEINAQPKPLALYIFSESKMTQQKVLRLTTSGGTCINDVISHLVNPNLPFGGVGNSGIGSYHGKHSFDTFSHKRSVFHNMGSVSGLVSLPPYNKKQLGIVRKIFH